MPHSFRKILAALVILCLLPVNLTFAHHLNGRQYWYRDSFSRNLIKTYVPNPGVSGNDQLIPGSYYSSSMEHKVGYFVYLPAGYNPSGNPYPVIYFLHGINGSEGSYFSGTDGYSSTSSLYSNTNLISLISNAHNSPNPRDTIVVFVNGGNGSFYMDYDGILDINGQDHHSSQIPPRYPLGVGDPFPNDWPGSFADFRLLVRKTIVEELIPHIDATYNTIKDRRGRGVEGFSMGGSGAWRIALQHPEMFCSTVGYAPAGLSSILPIYSQMYGGIPLLDRDKATAIAVNNISNIVANNLKLRAVTGGSDSPDWYNAGLDVRSALITGGLPPDNIDIPPRPPGINHSNINLNNAAGQASFDFHWNCFNSFSQTSSPPPSPSPLPGDIIPNGKVDIFDYNALLQDFGKTSGFNPLSDIVVNGKIDIFDYNGLLQNFGKTSP